MRPVDPHYGVAWDQQEGAKFTPLPKATVKPITVYFDHNILHVKTRRGIGFRWICECGEEGARHKFRSEAVAGLKWHRQEKHGG